MYMHMCVQTDVYTDVFLGAGHAPNERQNEDPSLTPREKNDLGLSELLLSLPGEWAH